MTFKSLQHLIIISIVLDDFLVLVNVVFQGGVVVLVVEVLPSLDVASRAVLVVGGILVIISFVVRILSTLFVIVVLVGLVVPMDIVL